MCDSILLSIIVPVYNVEKYLPICIESVLKQYCSGVEVVLVNDGSKDKSLFICEDFVSKYEFISLVNQTNKGLSEARNTGIRNAKGEYLLFLDSDDYLAPDTLAQVLSAVSIADVDFFMGRSISFYGNNEGLTLNQVNYDEITYLSTIECFSKLNLIDEFWFAAWLIIINRDFLLENNLYFKTGILHEDELWVPSVFIKASSVKLPNIGFYCYRTNRPDSIVSVPNIKREFDKLRIIEEFDKLKSTSIEANNLLSVRQASLVFGIILSLKDFKNHQWIKELKEELNAKLPLMKGGKYAAVRIACSIIGVTTVSSLLRIFFK